MATPDDEVRVLNVEWEDVVVAVEVLLVVEVDRLLDVDVDEDEEDSDEEWVDEV